MKPNYYLIALLKEKRQEVVEQIEALDVLINMYEQESLEKNINFYG